MRILKFVPQPYQIGLIIIISSLFSCGLAQPQKPTNKYHQYLQQVNNRGQLNGNVLVIEHGELVYQGAFGTANMKAQAALNLNTSFRLASVTKQFTAMAVMILKEEGKLSYDQDIRDFLPELPYEGITIKHLLHHTSGLPNEEELMDKFWKPELSNNNYRKNISGNQDIINTLVAHKPPVYDKPGEEFRYNNTGYMLLATIVSRVSGMSFSQYLKEKIFDPANMTNTVVYNYTPDLDPNMPNRALGYRKELNGMAFTLADAHYLNASEGEGGIYSTLGDLMKWDRILYTDKLVTQSTLKEAFTPAILNNGDTTKYGFGWFIDKSLLGTKKVWHTGDWLGFQSYIGRETEEDNCIIILSNSANNYFWPIIEGLTNILHNQPYQLPRLSIKEEIGATVLNAGLASGIERYKQIKADHPDDYIFNEKELNVLGYSLLWEARTKDAEGIFKLNIEEYPDTANCYDSLGDLFMTMGDTTNALLNFRKALELDPSMDMSQRKIDKLEGKNTEPMEPLMKPNGGC